MEPIIFAYAFFVLLALAAISGIIGFFRDDDDRKNRYQPHENQFPDQMHRDDSGYNRPIIIYTAAPPHDPYYHHQPGYYGNRKPMWSPVLIILGLAAGLVYYLSNQDIDSPKLNHKKPDQPEVPEQKERKKKEDIIHETYPDGKPSYVNQKPFHTEKWFTTISGYTSNAEAWAAMHKIALAIDEKEVMFYTSLSQDGQFMVYAPANSETEAEEIQMLIINHYGQLRKYCPAAPEILNVE